MTNTDKREALYLIGNSSHDHKTGESPQLGNSQNRSWSGRPKNHHTFMILRGRLLLAVVPDMLQCNAKVAPEPNPKR